MPNAPEPDRSSTPRRDPAGERTANSGDETVEKQAQVSSPDSKNTDPETVVFSKPDEGASTVPEAPTPERRFTAPGFDAKETQIMATAPDAATEAFAQPHTQQQPQPGKAAPTAPPPGTPPKAALPQAIPPRSGKLPAIPARFNWGWVLAITVIILAIAVIAVMLAVLLTKNKHQAASQDDQVRQTIQNYVTALQKGDLTTLRSMTCGATRDSYVEMDGHGWDETYRGVSAAKQYPVLGSIDQVVVNGQHAEANITTFMAYDPQVRSTRSLDLQFRDDQWKICQTSS